jgi:hypothetical protein
MTRSQPLGLDELMIVNPGPSDSGAFFLGEDGTLYQVQGLSQGDGLPGPGQFFLGEDGTLYQVQGPGLRSPPERTAHAGEGLGEDTCCQLGRFFLGEDGTLYEVVRE